MTRLGLINTYSTHNLGDSAIYSALAAMATTSLSDQAVQVMAAVDEAEHIDTPGVAFVDALPDCDACISVGGDIFNNARPALLTRNFLHLLGELKRLPDKTLLFGQSIPPSCRGLSFRLLAHTLKKLPAVVVRDALSHQRLRAAGVEAVLSYDSVFGLAPDSCREAEASTWLQARDIAPENSVILSLRHFDSVMYPHDNEAFLQKMVALCERLDEAGLQPVILLQSKTSSVDSDAWMAEKILEKAPQAKKLDAFDSTVRSLNWQWLAALLAVVRGVVGVRYHTNIFRLLYGKQAYNLHYSTKGQDLSERLGVAGASVGSFSPQAVVDWLLEHGEAAFDIAPVRVQVRADFHQALLKTLAK